MLSFPKKIIKNRNLWPGNTVMVKYDQKYARQAYRNGCFLEAQMDSDQLVRTVVVGRH